MADNKKYYYMRLKEHFFDSSEISLLESMPDGYLYSNILLKLYLRSLRGEGRLAINNIPYSPEMIATVTHHPVETVQKALDIFQKLGLIEILDSGVIYMLNIQEFIGESSTEADRIRAYRQRIAQEKRVQMYDKHTPEIEIELEIKKERKKEYRIHQRGRVDGERFALLFSELRGVYWASPPIGAPGQAPGNSLHSN